MNCAHDWQSGRERLEQDERLPLKWIVGWVHEGISPSVLIGLLLTVQLSEKFDRGARGRDGRRLLPKTTFNRWGACANEPNLPVGRREVRHTPQSFQKLEAPLLWQEIREVEESETRADATGRRGAGETSAGIGHDVRHAKDLIAGDKPFELLPESRRQSPSLIHLAKHQSNHPAHHSRRPPVEVLEVPPMEVNNELSPVGFGYGNEYGIADESPRALRDRQIHSRVRSATECKRKLTGVLEPEEYVTEIKTADRAQRSRISRIDVVNAALQLLKSRHDLDRHRSHAMNGGRCGPNNNEFRRSR